MSRGGEREEQARTSTAAVRRVSAGRRHQRQTAAVQNPPVQWSAINDCFGDHEVSLF